MESCPCKPRGGTTGRGEDAERTLQWSLQDAHVALVQCEHLRGAVPVQDYGGIRETDPETAIAVDYLTRHLDIVFERESS